MTLASDTDTKVTVNRIEIAPALRKQPGARPKGDRPLSTEQDTPYGCCQCGCGEKTVVSPHTDRDHGWTRGEPRRFVQGHAPRLNRSQFEPTDRGFDTECHIWCGTKNERGYGLAKWAGSDAHLAHRITWEIQNGPVPEGLELDHLCRQRDCVNPDHLEAVTHSENMKRGAFARYREEGAAHPLVASRMRLHLSQVETGERLGVSSSIVSMWETGKVPVPSQLDVENLRWTGPHGVIALTIRRVRVKEMFQQGYSYKEMSEELGVSTGTLTSDIRWLRDQGEDMPVRNPAFDRPIGAGA